ncbi:RNA polymerase sigma factor [Promicromonospora citrea]|uniref:RNA polymerase sigma factor (Sigma-70 family) n=3 Tax=Promicromonospora citrea TaxID=43677 RepID=A0A8H9GFV8_9MICO|nr:sigma-70 family RNA polymerase sigma factor [Promicromonospora citrea]GGM20378.1 hypothetical protein GCM10010102_15090 [Promicromonospora citrea]
MKQAESSTGETPSDAELILQVRSGNREAFGVLYERHAAAARALARQYVSPSDAEDVVADAFSKLFEMLRRGAGPDAGFRPYLYTVVRHRAFDVSRGAARNRPSTDDEIESVLGRVASEEDPALAGFERSVVSRAYFDLPERWREVLWYVLVDDLKPAQVAPVLGLSPNGVSALLYRAKEALRAGYLQQHLTHAPSDTCRSVNPLLGGYVRESLSKRETAKITEHLSTCGTCSALVLELHDVAHGMKTVIAPLVLGAGGLVLVGAGAPIGGLAVAAKAGAGAAVGTPAATASTVGAVSTAGGGVSSAVSATAGAVASAAAAATGGSVAAGAIAVAAVGVVAALQLTSPIEAAPVSVADAVVATQDGREESGAETVDDSPALPTDVDADGSTTTTVPYLVLGYADADQPLQPRQTQDLSFVLENTGEVPATGTQLEITLPEGMSVARPSGPFGAGVGGRLVAASATEPVDTASTPPVPTTSPTGAASTTTPGTAEGTVEAGEPAGEGETQAMPDTPPATPDTVGLTSTTGPAACTRTEQEAILHCALGEIAPGEVVRVVVPVRATAGGDYPVGAEVWADGMEPTELDLPGRTVAPFGPELTAATEGVSLASPGTAMLPVRLTSTGDRGVAAGAWAVEVALPAGVRPASAQPELSCTAADGPNAWRCAPAAGTAAAAVELSPGGVVDTALTIAAVGESSATWSELGAATVRPVVEGNAHSASATLALTSAWADAATGAGQASAVCLDSGPAGTAKAAVAGTYTNTTERTVRVAMEAAGQQSAFSDKLAPGSSVQLVVPDGLRVPAGQASYVLSTEVDGSPFTTRVGAGEHAAKDCYVPRWETETSVRTLNHGGSVAVEGTLTNRTAETMSVVLRVPVGDTVLESDVRRVAAGGTATLTVNTDRRELAGGEATFRLSREGVDEDGDLPAGPVTPRKHPTKSFDSARIAPVMLAASAVAAGECQFDPARDASVKTFTVGVSNKESTLPVTFHVGDVTKTVPAGETATIEYTVVWGTGTVDLRAAGQTLGTLEVAFDSCAELTWSATDVGVAVATECVDRTVRITAAVENRTGRDWTGLLTREATGESSPETQVPAGATTALEIVRQVPMGNGGYVTLRLTRELEGEKRHVEQTFWAKGAACLGNEGGDICRPAPTPDQSAPPSASPAPASMRSGRSWPWGGFCD